MKGSQGWFGGLSEGAAPFLVSDLTAFYSSLDSRHLQEQAHVAAVLKQRPNIGHDLSVFTEMKGGRNGAPSRSEGAF